ncbi:phosphoserine phosphatase [Photobacterium jeanii]|uniref:Phosphoserine phosphatase n=1 Tax=Photobacterium jeanii TaxID=858640 RepID=A0A178KA10_9GAMM|nr:phosphoserine phosphatase [Photobacterium jeanii]OAN14210.1 phosphoserine phosphatase [Photobacterium jeanii]PST89730.1 phosphoserine phosphatase [Photobacterium jeanii]
MLKIRKHISLQQRFPEMIGTPNLLKQKATTLLYGRVISPMMIETIGDQAGEYLSVVAGWKVGDYDAVLIENPLHLRLEQAIIDHEIDFVATSDLPDLREPGLVVMDMDSTAIEIECIDEIAKLAGVGEQVAAVTERAMQGELDFEQSLRQRVATLQGADEAILAQVREQLPLMPELRELVKALQECGWRVAIASGGFTYFADYLKQELGLVHAYANNLAIENGKLTGEVAGDVVDAQAKANVLLELAEHFDIAPHNTVAVGDGANDLVMMTAAGLGIAYHAKPKVEAQASAAVRFADLGGVMCILSASLLPQGISW